MAKLKFHKVHIIYSSEQKKVIESTIYLFIIIIIKWQYKF